MKLEITQNTNTVDISEIKVGECFEYKGKYFMRTDAKLRKSDKEVHSVLCDGTETLFSSVPTMVRRIPNAKWVC